MSPSFPYNRNRRYLTGVDWIIGTLDCATQRATGAGNSSQIILELEGRLEENRLRDCVERFAALLPALSGYPSRDWLNLAPFWKIDRPVGHCTVRLLPAQPTPEAALGQLCKAVNIPFPTRRDHLAFHLVHAGPERSFLGMVFDHRLFDARGAELFLDRLAAFAAGNEEVPPPELTHPHREPYLSDWAGKFRAGRNVNRAIRQCGAVNPARLPLPAGKPGFEFQFQKLDEAESQRLTGKAYELGGYLVKMPYLLALAVEAVDRIFLQRELTPEHYVIPVSIDRRATRADNQTLLFNHVSFVYFLISREELGSRESLVKSITRQMYEQTKSRLAKDFEQTMMLMRILPVGVLATLSQRLFGGNFGSFAFSCVGESACRARQFLGHPITNLLHIPRVSTPPGVGVFVNEFAGRMNITTASLSGLLTDSEAKAIGASFQMT